MQQRVREVNRAIDKVNQANRRVVSEHNAAVRQHNSEVRRHNAEVRQRRQAYKNAVAQYNRAVTTHNSKVRSNRARIAQQARSLQSRQTTRYVEVRTTTVDLLQRFERVASEPVATHEHAELIRLAEVESTNSAEVAEKLLDETPAEEIPDEEPTGILSYLSDLSDDLHARWVGAIHALSPTNPEACRHFCASTREIFTEILEKWADDADVVAADPNCQRTPNGSKPTRRAKIRYLLGLKGAATPEMIGFVEADIENVVRLFDDFNEGTHGAAGKFGFTRLQAIRKRVEGGIMFLATIAA